MWNLQLGCILFPISFILFLLPLNILWHYLITKRIRFTFKRKNKSQKSKDEKTTSVEVNVEIVCAQTNVLWPHASHHVFGSFVREWRNGRDGDIRIWSALDQKNDLFELKQTLVGHKHYVICLASKGFYLASGSLKEIRIWHLMMTMNEDGRQVKVETNNISF